MGRHPLGDIPMTNAERQRRWRAGEARKPVLHHFHEFKIKLKFVEPCTDAEALHGARLELDGLHFDHLTTFTITKLWR